MALGLLHRLGVTPRCHGSRLAGRAPQGRPCLASILEPVLIHREPRTNPREIDLAALTALTLRPERRCRCKHWFE